MVYALLNSYTYDNISLKVIERHMSILSSLKLISKKVCCYSTMMKLINYYTTFRVVSNFLLVYFAVYLLIMLCKCQQYIICISLINSIITFN